MLKFYKINSHNGLHDIILNVKGPKIHLFNDEIDLDLCMHSAKFSSHTLEGK